MLENEHFFRALKISLIIGTVLNIINQGDVLFEKDFHSVNFIKLGLTYIIPFLVSGYTALKMKK